MNLRTILILVLTALWFLFCSHWYVCWIKEVCHDREVPTETTELTIPDGDERPLLFTWGSAEPIINEAYFPAFKERILGNQKDSNNLEIEGIYYEGEAESIGLARAEAVRKLFGEVPEGRFKLGSRLVTGKSDLQNKLFEACELFWIDRSPDDIAKGEVDGEDGQGEGDDKKGDGLPEETVVKLADRILIYHFYNSTEKTVDPKVDEYLDQLSQRLSQTDEKVSLTGHTDAQGSDQYNMELGMDRANAIKAILMEKGVPEDRIQTATKGESELIDTSETEDAHAKNRRTEVLLLKN